MIKSKKQQPFVDWAIRHGYVRDAFGHYQKTDSKTGKVYRLKFQDTALRLEVKALIGGKNEWIRLRSGYYSKCGINPETDTLWGMSK